MFILITPYHLISLLIQSSKIAIYSTVFRIRQKITKLKYYVLILTNFNSEWNS